MVQTNGNLTLSAEQVKELRAFLVKQPYEVAQPIMMFLAQVEAEQARKIQESIPKESEEEQNSVGTQVASETATGKTKGRHDKKVW